MQSEWAWRPLGDIFRIHREGINPGAHPAEVFEHYSIPAFDETGGPAIQAGIEIESNKSNLSQPVILVSKLNPRKPRVMLVTGSSGLRRCASTEWIPYVPQIAGVDLVYYKWLFGSTGFSRQLEKVATGSTNSHVRVSPSETLRWTVAYPPLPEQRHIAEILDTLDEAIRKTVQVISKLQQMKQGLLQDLLTRGIDENGELRDPERHPEQFKDSPLGRIPTRWEIAPFRSLCISSAFGPRFSSELYADHGDLATLRTTDMDNDGNINLHTMPRAAIAPASLSMHLLTEGDLLISRSGTCGIASVFPGFGIPVVPGAFLIRFRLSRPEFSHFCRCYFNSPLGRPRLERLAVGGVQKNLKGSSVLSLPVPIVPNHEITYIQKLLSEADLLVENESTGLGKLRILKQGLTDDLLTGRVRVPASRRQLQRDARK